MIWPSSEALCAPPGQSSSKQVASQVMARRFAPLQVSPKNFLLHFTNKPFYALKSAILWRPCSITCFNV